MRLVYQAFDKAGRSINDTIEAASSDDAKEQLRRQGVFVTQVTETSGSGGPRRVRGTGQHKAAAPGASAGAAPVAARGRGFLAQRLAWVRGGRRLKHLAMFTRQLHVLLSTGTPMVEALHALARQTRDPQWKAVIADLRDQVEQGNPLSQAMGEHLDCFDPVYRSLISAGERGGKFEPILDRLSTLTRKQMKTRKALTGALVYPTLLLTVSSVVLASMFVVVLPRFSTLFDTLNLPLPPTTRALMALSNLATGYWWVIAPAVIAAAGATVWWLTTAAGRRALDTALVRVPMIREVTKSFLTARIIRLLGVLSDSYIPLLDSLDLARQAAVNAHYQKLLTEAQDAVTRGEPISTAFQDERLITPTVYEALRSGESTGKVSGLLLNMADFLDEDNEVVLKTLTSLLEPVILVGMGLLVGLVAVSMFLPLFDLTAQAGAA